MKQIEITDKLIVVVVPQNAIDIINYTKYLTISTKKPAIINLSIDRRPFTIELDKYNILGTVTSAREIDFECEEYVEKGSYVNTFKNYITNDNHKSNQLNTAQESFLSLLQSKVIELDKLDNQKLLIIEKI